LQGFLFVSETNYPSGEYELLARLQQVLGATAAPGGAYELTLGDDAAIRACGNGERIALTTDIAVENVHFTLDTMTMREIGFRTMAANLSDCAAMGAIPDSALVQLVFPRGAEQLAEKITELYAGFAEACRLWNFRIVGGDLAGGANWTIGITLLGTASCDRMLKRKGIIAGDRLWTSGFPGQSAAGLAALQKWGRYGIPEHFRRLVGCHIWPIPAIELGVALAKNPEAHAMMDLSDGISKDCRTLCFDNNLGLSIDLDALTPPEDMVALGRELSIPWEYWALHGGEEYELLVVTSPQFDPVRFVPGGDLHKVFCDSREAVPGPAGASIPPLLSLGVFSHESNRITVIAGGRTSDLPRGSWDHVARSLHPQ
jgi:thiamine-monophosphate kinase